jgi:hypothetical protein
MRIPRFLVLLSLATFALCAASFADSPFNFAAFGTGDIGHTDTFPTSPAGPFSLTAWGFSADGVNTDLWYKADGGDETGLGLSNDTVDHEIQGSSFLEFTTAHVTTITIGSVQSGESWAIYGSNSIGTRGTTLLASGTTDVPPPAGGLNLAAIDSGWTYVSLFAPTGNILLDGANAAPPAVPEPSTPAFILTLGLIGLFEIGRRKLTA